MSPRFVFLFLVLAFGLAVMLATAGIEFNLCWWWGKSCPKKPLNPDAPAMKRVEDGTL
jgi:hypothetical protein